MLSVNKLEDRSGSPCKCYYKSVKTSGATLYCTLCRWVGLTAVAGSIVDVSLLLYIILSFLVMEYSLCVRLGVLNGFCNGRQSAFKRGN